MEVSSEELLKAPDLPMPKYPVKSIHGIEVYSEPDQYQTDLNSSENRKIALGVHPKVIQRLTEERLQRLGELILLPQVIALGEIGLDRMTPSSSWKRQEETLVRLLELGLPRKPIIMHIRGTQEDKYSIDVSNCALKLMLHCCAPLQRLHRHCFTGNRWLIHRWMKAFSNIYFGFTGRVVKFDSEQRRALQEVPADRLLIETDSRYFPLTPEVNVNTPRYIGDVAAAVAEIRGVSTHELLDITVANTRCLYQI
ncbi:uncharacterized metal-dependent hydrolase YcfH-like [Ptychodera flava]|uniref:uncharacterized metal-dependent hydrolase YcfH-like n=1 Tax=Ptychodera flava TaxID=63121 RepID=UPI003969D877